MLRLWPETLYAGLFSGAAWLSGSGRMIQQRSPAGGDDLLAELEAMLQLLPPLTGPRRLHLQISDSLAVVAMLPWQEQLRDQAELVAYAQACFDRNGLEIGDDWVTYPGYRHFGCNGMAYAVPRIWLEQLLAICERQRIRLESVLPISGAAYWRAPRTAPAKGSLVLLSEPQRVSALAYQAGGLAATDVQPVTGDAEMAGRRLLSRLRARYAGFTEVSHWSPAAVDLTAPPFISEQFAAATIVQLAREVWK